MNMARRTKTISRRKGTFDPHDTYHVTHSRLGVWDLYEQKHTPIIKVPGSSRFERLAEFKQSLPYVWRMLKDIGSIKGLWLLLVSYLVAEVVSALMPALSLWYKGQLLTIVQTAVESRTVDKNILFRATSGVVVCKVTIRILSHVKAMLSHPLQAAIKRHYSLHIFNAHARLDVPTYDDVAVQTQLEAASQIGGQSIAWVTVNTVFGLMSTMLHMVSQLTVLWGVLKEQRDGLLLAALSCIQVAFEWVEWQHRSPLRDGVWAATTKNSDYIKLQGLKRVVTEFIHRKEFVAGNLSRYMISLFRHLSNRVGDDADNFWPTVQSHRAREKLTIFSLLKEPFSELPQIVFALRAVQYPASIPVSLASLNLITQATTSFSHTSRYFFLQTGSIIERCESVRKLYEVLNVPNKIVDGAIPFPEERQKVRSGLSLEFRNVSFRYPGSTEYALKDISFKLQQGQLCVIVGTNGSGKSTILKLIVRLYDPTEGQILIDGKDIRTVKLHDLRETISVLFQDYTFFPLSVRDNIGIGDPSHAHDEERIRLAARLGGSEEIIDKLPEGFDTYLERPVADCYGGLPEGTQSLFGRPVDYSSVRSAGGMVSSRSSGLSGGQMQRLAVSRTFMRSVVSDDSSVGLLLFDEPSASLDPTAEHDLFGRLRELRGNKTMLFSSHRFGNLTRHADLILYMNNSEILETGTHEQLLQRQGDYARIWKLQAQAFL